MSDTLAWTIIGLVYIFAGIALERRRYNTRRNVGRNARARALNNAIDTVCEILAVVLIVLVWPLAVMCACFTPFLRLFRYR